MHRRVELRSPDPCANPYLAFALIIHACLFGLEKKELPPEAADVNLFDAEYEDIKKYKKLPIKLCEAAKTAQASEFVNELLPKSLIRVYSQR